MNNEPTKTTTTEPVTLNDTTATVTTEFEAKHSVELTNTVKDGWRISSVKVYGMNAMDAAHIAIETAEAAEELLRNSSLNARNER